MTDLGGDVLNFAADWIPVLLPHIGVRRTPMENPKGLIGES